MGSFARVRRLTHIVAVLLRHGVAHAVCRRLPRWRWLDRCVPGRDLTGPERLRRVFTELGGTFIKFGQMLALQPDILSLEYCNALLDLMDRVEAFPLEQVERTFREEFGKTTGEIFEWFEPRPLATASVGQVHAGRLCGRKVAVKVRRPSVEAEFGGDIRLMNSVIRLIKRLGLRRIEWVVEPMSEFVAWTREEMDFRFEARYQERLRDNARNNPAERVPAVEWQYTSRQTLVMEFFEGVTVLNYLRAARHGDGQVLARLRALRFEPDAFARHIIDNFLGDAFRHGMFHADLHPANLMILADNVVGYVDFGITGVLSAYSRRHLIAMTLAYTRGDLEAMSAAFLQVSAVGPNSDTDGFREGLRRLADDWYETRGRERRLRKNFTLVMLDMLRLSRRTGVWPEKDVIKYIRSAIASDGLITRFAPSFDIGSYLERVCSRHLKWHSLGALLSYEAVLGWSTSGNRLVRDGVLRGMSVLRRLAAGDLPARAEAGLNPGDPDAPGRVRALQLGAIACGLAALVVLTGERPLPGLNLFTLAAVLAAAAVVLLLRALRRLA